MILKYLKCVVFITRFSSQSLNTGTRLSKIYRASDLNHRPSGYKWAWKIKLPWLGTAFLDNFYNRSIKLRKIKYSQNNRSTCNRQNDF